MTTKNIKAINGEEAAKLLLHGKQISMHPDMVPRYEIYVNGAPVMIDKDGDLSMLFGNSEAYSMFMERLSEEYTWYTYED